MLENQGAYDQKIDIPTKVIINILSFLENPNDLRNCLLVSRTFKELIIKTPKLMRKLDVEILMDGLWREKLEFLELFGDYVMSLRISNIQAEHHHAVRDILTSVPNIERLICVEVNDEEQNEDYETIEFNFPKLSTVYLHLHPKGHKFFKNLLRNCKNFKSFNVLFYSVDETCDYSELVAKQDNLQELCINSYDEYVLQTIFSPKFHGNYKFRLKKLSIESGLVWNEYFYSFLRTQAESILYLTLSSMNFRYLRTILNDFKVLEEFKFFIDQMFNDQKLAEVENHRLESVKSLDIEGINYDLVIFRTMLNTFPNIETLCVESLCEIPLFGTLDKFPNLTALKIFNFAIEPMVDVKIPSLKILEIESLYPSPSKSSWENLTRNCENLEKISIGSLQRLRLNASIRAEYARIFKSLQNLKKLKHFQINKTDAQELQEDFAIGVDYRVRVNVDQKVINISAYIQQHFVNEIDILKDIFENFETVEF